MTLKEPAPPKGKKQNSIGARISALALHDSGAPFEVIEKQTQVTQSGVYKLLKKAKERG